MWRPGDIVALRGICHNRPRYVQSAMVVKDSPGEVALAIIPGAECAAPAGYLPGTTENKRKTELWELYKSNHWTLGTYRWHTNRFLILLEPGKFYSTVYIWEEETDKFKCYYINFQLPFKPSHCGFDTLDLELDIVVDPSFRWRWKDLEEYQNGIENGMILQEWRLGIEACQPEIFRKIERHAYPLDGSWLDWRPDAAWSPPRLPADWEKV